MRAIASALSALAALLQLVCGHRLCAAAAGSIASPTVEFDLAMPERDRQAFAVPKPWPMTAELGTRCRAMILNRKLRPGVKLESITLEALSQESVIGLMGMSSMNPKSLRN